MNTLYVTAQEVSTLDFCWPLQVSWSRFQHQAKQVKKHAMEATARNGLVVDCRRFLRLILWVVNNWSIIKNRFDSRLHLLSIVDWFHCLIYGASYDKEVIKKLKIISDCINCKMRIFPRMISAYVCMAWNWAISLAWFPSGCHFVWQVISVPSVEMNKKEKKTNNCGTCRSHLIWRI